jgi:dihydropteroate synthase type 2
VTPRLFGIVNSTEDSFSDGARFLDPARALEHARALVAAGAWAIDLGAAASHPDSKPVPPELEIRRLEPLVDALLAEGARVSVDSFQRETQAWALGRGVHYLNDIGGFGDASLWPELARASCALVVMHSVQERGAATRVHGDPAQIVERVGAFFARRIAELERAGVARERLILDPGMGFFLGSNPEPSIAVLRALPELRSRFALPLFVCVSRKSFVGALGGAPPRERLPGTLAAELFAAAQGVDYLRTHDVAALVQALRVAGALEG